MKSNTSNNSDLNEQDNKFFDAYLEGDSPLSEIYKTVNCAEPSNMLNQTILVTARTSTEQLSTTKRWWTQASSWAASITIISLAGILTYNTWQAEQDAINKEIQGEGLDSFSQVPSQQGRLAEQEAVSRPYKARIEADPQVGQEPPNLSRAKKNIIRDSSKDSRQLQYKSAPAPIMQSAPDYFKSTKTESLFKESHIQRFEDSHEEIPYPSEVKTKKVQEKPLTEQQIMLKEITQLIENNKIDQAQELLSQFKTKYPDYSIDPVIFKHLSPY